MLHLKKEREVKVYESICKNGKDGQKTVAYGTMKRYLWK